MSGSDIAVRVARIDTVAERIKRIRLVRTNGGPLPTFSAGSHVVIAMRDGQQNDQKSIFPDGLIERFERL